MWHKVWILLEPPTYRIWFLWRSVAIYPQNAAWSLLCNFECTLGSPEREREGSGAVGNKPDLLHYILEGWLHWELKCWSNVTRVGSLYHIVGNFKGWKLSWFCGYSWKFSLRNLWVRCLLAWHEWAIRESFLCENCIFTNLRQFSPSKVFRYTVLVLLIVNSPYTAKITWLE